MRKWIAAFLVCVGILCGGNAAMALCVGSAGLVFNCTAGATPTANDLVLGGSETGAQNGKVVSWTWAQVQALIEANLGSAASASTGTTGHVLPYLDGLNLWAGSNTFPNGDLGMRGSGAGVTTDVSANASATNYTWTKPAGNGTPLWFATGTPPIAGQCNTQADATGRVTFGACPTGGGGGGSGVSFTDAYGNNIPSVLALTMLGGQLSGTASAAQWSPATGSRTVTGTGGVCPAAGVTPGPTVNTLCPWDMGGIVVLNGSSLPFTIGAFSGSLLPAYSQVTITNNATTPATITSTPPISGYPTTGAGPYVAVLPGLQNGVASSLGLTSNGSSLQDTFALPPGVAFTTVVDQPRSGGFIDTPYANAATSGTVTIDAGKSVVQTVTNNGAMTLNMGTNLGMTYLRLTNGASASSLAFGSMFQVGSNTGDSYDTTSGDAFDIELLNIAPGGTAPGYLIHKRNSGTSAFALIGTPVEWQGAATQTSGTYNTTGANVIYVAEAWYSQAGNTGGTLADAYGNSCPSQGVYNSYGAVSVQIFKCTSPVVGTAETFTITGSSAFTAGILAFAAPGGFAQDGSVVGSNNVTAPTVQSGPITPSVANDLFVIASSDSDVGVTPTIGSGFNLPIASPAVTSSYEGLAMGWFLNTGVGALNPTVTWPAGTGTASATMTAEKP